MITSVITNPVVWYTMFRGRISGEWTQDGFEITRPFFYYKKGIEGVERYISGDKTLRPPGTYTWEYTLTGLYPNSDYYYEFGVILDDIKYYGSWLYFTTNLPIFYPQEATEITETSAKLNGMWYQDDRGSLAPMFEWKKGEGGEVFYFSYSGTTRDAGEYTSSKVVESLEPLQTYFFRFGVYDALHVKFWGIWVSFFTGEYREIHFRAYGWDPKGNIIYGEDMSFEY